MVFTRSSVVLAIRLRHSSGSSSLSFASRDMMLEPTLPVHCDSIPGLSSMGESARTRLPWRCDLEEECQPCAVNAAKLAMRRSCLPSKPGSSTAVFGERRASGVPGMRSISYSRSSSGNSRSSIRVAGANDGYISLAACAMWRLSACCAGLIWTIVEAGSLPFEVLSSSWRSGLSLVLGILLAALSLLSKLLHLTPRVCQLHSSYASPPIL
jgi:hypothetical protein